MPTVISKFLEKSEQTRMFFQIPKHYITGSIAASVLLVYGLKVGYPLIESCFKAEGGHKVTENNNLWHTDKRENGKKNPQPVKEHVSCRDANQTKTSNGRRGAIPALNWTFLYQFLTLARIMIPHPICLETTLLSSHTLFLLLRTFLSIYVANMEGAIVKYIVRKDAKNFAKMLLKWFTIALPATFINSMIRYLESRLALAFRSRLVEHSYRLYFKNQSYYRITVLDGRLDNCAQRLTDDIEVVATTVSHLYSQITKPLFDLLLIGLALAGLTRSARASIVPGPLLIMSVVCITGYILRTVSPRFGQLVAQEAEKKGYLRHVHSRLIANAEEIAFYGGHRVELSHLRLAYRNLVDHMEKVFNVKLWFVMLEQFLMKYVWSGAGMVVVSLPILMANVKSTHSDGGISERTQYFTTAKNLLLSASDAVERLMSSYKDIVELAGHTARVANMFEVFEEASKGIYQKTLVAKKDSPNESFKLEYRNGQPVARGTLQYTKNGEIVLDAVPIVTPNCDVVCPSLSLELKPGMHLLITGPNGCGKSSLFRILSGLWPIYSGQLKIPSNSMFYIPQRPYMVIGNLRDQIIYPDTSADMINKQVTEDDLRSIMRTVHLEHIVKRDSLDAVKDWTDILSGGEKQRMAMARLFYHKPKYALLDECTSAVSIDVESNIYQAAKDLGITLLTITHRPTLWKFHTHILQFDGAGAWELSELNTTQRLDLKREKEQLLKEDESEGRSVRLRELSRLLGEDVES